MTTKNNKRILASLLGFKRLKWESRGLTVYALKQDKKIEITVPLKISMRNLIEVYVQYRLNQMIRSMPMCKLDKKLDEVWKGEER